ncbi:fructokinase [Gemmatimonadetes bacterium T265]|nr:fructokinase [Gemmatimonadetes bacterium T265]
MSRSEVLCVGEVLWDSLPAGLFIGGAPFNVAGHLHALGVPVGVVSRVGRDQLGAEALARLARHGIATDLVQTDPALRTGFVSVSVDAAGVPAYDIVEPAAWDLIELRASLLERAAGAGAIVFGSLAQRHRVSRATIERLCEVDVMKVFDVNLRPPYDDAEVVRRALARADVVKLNEPELEQMAGWFGLPAGLRAGALALADRYGCRTVCVTRGAAGAVLLNAGRWSEHGGYRVAVRDTVGSGDAFLAALLSGLLAGSDDDVLLQHANLRGAYVASRDGAIPVYDQEVLTLIRAHGVPPSAVAPAGFARTPAGRIPPPPARSR